MDGVYNIEHERKEGTEEIEFHIMWESDRKKNYCSFESELKVTVILTPPIR